MSRVCACASLAVFCLDSAVVLLLFVTVHHSNFFMLNLDDSCG